MYYKLLHKNLLPQHIDTSPSCHLLSCFLELSNITSLTFRHNEQSLWLLFLPSSCSICFIKCGFQRTAAYSHAELMKTMIASIFVNVSYKFANELNIVRTFLLMWSSGESLLFIITIKSFSVSGIPVYCCSPVSVRLFCTFPISYTMGFICSKFHLPLITFLIIYIDLSAVPYVSLCLLFSL